MPAGETPTRARVLIISDRTDEPIENLCRALANARADVEVVGNVYGGMAMLARGDVSKRVLVDVRGLDQHEIQFIRLAPRYFQIEIIVPLLPGTLERLRDFSERVTTATIDAVVAGLRSPEIVSIGRLDEPSPIHEVHVAGHSTDDSEAPPAVPPGALSTDGGPETAETGPAMHEAVRMRMSQGQQGTVRRGPPRSADAPATEMPTGGDVDSAVTPEELRELLRSETEEAPSPTARRNPWAGGAK